MAVAVGAMAAGVKVATVAVPLAVAKAAINKVVVTVADSLAGYVSGMAHTPILFLVLRAVCILLPFSSASVALCHFVFAIF